MCRMSRGGGHVPGVGILGAGCPVGVASYYSARRASDVDGIMEGEAGADVSDGHFEKIGLQPKGRCWELGDHTTPRAAGPCKFK